MEGMEIYDWPSVSDCGRRALVRTCMAFDEDWEKLWLGDRPNDQILRGLPWCLKNYRPEWWAKLR
jgi:hypothetical protein